MLKESELRGNLDVADLETSPGAMELLAAGAAGGLLRSPSIDSPAPAGVLSYNRKNFMFDKAQK